MTQRIPSAPATPEVTAILDQMAKGPDGDRSPALYLTMANHPPLLDALRQTGDTLRRDTRLEADDRELIVHRVSAQCGSGYEWGIHARLFAPPLGLGEDWLAATWTGAPEDFEKPAHRVLARVCDELHADATISDATWPAVRELFDDAQIVDILFMVGYYHLVCFVENALRLPPEPWAHPVPESDPGRGAAG